MKTIKITLCIFSLSMVFLSCAKKKIEPSEYFKIYILEPQPKSVTNMKVDQTSNILGYGYVFGFNIEKNDLTKIIDSLTLKKC